MWVAVRGRRLYRRRARRYLASKPACHDLVGAMTRALIQAYLEIAALRLGVSGTCAGDRRQCERANRGQKLCHGLLLACSRELLDSIASENDPGFSSLIAFSAKTLVAFLRALNAKGKTLVIRLLLLHLAPSCSPYVHYGPGYAGSMFRHCRLP
jgi:hypothetical protein